MSALLPNSVRDLTLGNVIDIKIAIDSMKNIEVKDEYTFEQIIEEIEKITVYHNELIIEFKSFISNEHLNIDYLKATISFI